MSAQGSPHAFGPRSPRHDVASNRANPLRRTSDRIEFWLSGLLLMLLALGLPVASLSAGLSAYESSMRTAQAQSAERLEVTARLTSYVAGDTEAAKQVARVHWTDQDGTARTGTTAVKSGTPKGTVRVWVDRDGRLTSPPLSELNATTTGWFVGGMAAAGVTTVIFAARAGMRQVLNHGRYAQWDAEWDRVEPQWSGRFRR